MNINPTVFYLGLIVLAIASLIASYFKVIPPEIFTTILGAILGHAVTIVAQTGGKPPSPPS